MRSDYGSRRRYNLRATTKLPLSASSPRTDRIKSKGITGLFKYFTRRVWGT